MNRGIDSVRKMMNFGLEHGKTNMVVFLDELKALFDALDAATAAGVGGVELDVTVVERKDGQ